MCSTYGKRTKPKKSKPRPKKYLVTYTAEITLIGVPTPANYTS